MDPELANVLGKAAHRVVLPNASSLNPKAAPKPKRPQQHMGPQAGLPSEVPPTPEGCIAPIFPIVPESDVHLYMQEARSSDDVIGNYQKGKIDPELNELALREVAAERGITVEELLAQNPDKKLEKKLEFADMENQNPPTPQPRQVQMSIDDARRMVMEADKPVHLSADEVELQAMEQKQAELRQRIADQKQPPRPAAPQAKAEPPPRKQHALLKSLRQKLSLDAIEPAVCEIEGFRFGMLPPPGSMQPWILEKISAANLLNSEQALMVTVRAALVSSALVTINDIPIAEVLGLTDEPVTNPLTISGDLRTLMAQTLWEMIAGVVSIEGLFTFNPQWVVQLYNHYEKEFKGFKLKNSDDQKKLHRYACPVPGCAETYELNPTPDGKVYCRLHGVQAQDAGPLEVADSLPLF